MLRDNSIFGPFSLYDITNAGLLQKDLIWIEQESSCWLPACSFQELKSYVKDKDEDLILEKRAQKKQPKKTIGFDQNDPLMGFGISGIPSPLSVSSFDGKAKVRLVFPERTAHPVSTKQVWKKRNYPVANLLNVVLVFISMSFLAFLIQQIVEGYDHNLMMVSAKEIPENKQASDALRMSFVRYAGLNNSKKR